MSARVVLAPLDAARASILRLARRAAEPLLIDVHPARRAYRRGAGFHAYLEIAVAVLFVLEGRWPLRRT